MMAKNPGLYRQMCEPHASRDEGNAALLKFFDAVEVARRECRISDVHVLGVIRWTESEEESEGMGRVHYGDSLRALPMLAEAYGRERAEFEALISGKKRGTP